MERSFCITVYESSHTKSSDIGTAYHTSNNDGTSYHFGYRVNAIETGDIKQHIESRLKNDVKGEYFVIEPNGFSQLVQYVANSNGFNAVARHQYGTKYSKNFGTNDIPRSNSDRQIDHHANILDGKINNLERLPQQQNVVAFDRFTLHEQNNKYLQQQNSVYRQSSPKSITNQSLIRLLENSTKKFTVSTDIPTTQNVVRKQYEVIDPEVDIDIRRSIPKPFLNLAKLKQPRRDNNK